MDWRRLEQELARLLKSYGCTLESASGEVWLENLPPDECTCGEDEITVEPISITAIAKQLERELQ